MIHKRVQTLLFLLEACRYSADTAIKEKSKVFVVFCVCREVRAGRPGSPSLSLVKKEKEKAETPRNVFTQEAFSVASFVLHVLFLRTNLNFLNKTLKCVNTVSSPRFLQLFLLVFEIYEQSG